METYGFSEKADLRASDVKLVKPPRLPGRGLPGVGPDGYGCGDRYARPVQRLQFPGGHRGLPPFRYPEEDVLAALEAAQTKGRIEKVKVSDDFTLLIDYAHNAMSLESLLTTLKEYHPKRLVCLFGCGGNRSRLRRFEMGEVSGRLADLTVITSDNPALRGAPGDHRRYPDRNREDGRKICGDHRPQGGDPLRDSAWTARRRDCAGRARAMRITRKSRGVKYPMDERVLIQEVLEELGREVKYANVIVDISLEKLDRTFQYRVPEALEASLSAGMQVRVPFGNGGRVLTAYVVELTDECEWDPARMKELSGDRGKGNRAGGPADCPGLLDDAACTAPP